MIFKPHNYQSYCTDYIKSHPIAALFLDMGLGKTAITLTAVNDLMLDTFDVSKVLVVAPLRVARDTWPTEVEKWEHLKFLTISVIVGDQKTRIGALNHPALVYVINRETIKWLIEYYEKNGLRWDFDMVIIDELSSFKNHQSQRFRFLRKIRPYVKRFVGLTGTPTSNGLMDLWAEIGILDGLNIQQGGHILIWFGLTWSLELYQQTNARLWRQGQTEVVTIYHIITKGTVDEDVMAALEQKDVTQEKLISAVKARLGK